MFKEPEFSLWEADPIDDELAVLRTVDEENTETGEIAGFAVPGFPGFERWDALPTYPILWQAASRELLPLVDLLKRELALRQKHHMATPRR